MGKAKLKPVFVKCTERMPTLDSESEDDETLEDASSTSEDNGDNEEGVSDSDES